MALTWTRLGYLGFMMPFAFWAISARIGGTSNFGAFRISFVLSALVVWFLGKHLNRDALEAGEDVPHKTFSRPMQHAVWVPAVGFVLTLL